MTKKTTSAKPSPATVAIQVLKMTNETLHHIRQEMAAKAKAVGSSALTRLNQVSEKLTFVVELLEGKHTAEIGEEEETP